MKSKYYLRDQAGFAMLLEVLLVALVLAIIGGAYYMAKNHQATPSQAEAVPTPSTVANGKVDNAVNALIDDSRRDDTAAAQDSAMTPAADTNNTQAQAAAGSIDENTF